MDTVAVLRRLSLLPAIGAAATAIACTAVLGSPDIFHESDASSCGNTQSDPHHCGRCGHDCLGGMCTQGVCQPTTVRAGIAPFSIAIDASYIFWSEPFSSRVAQINKDLTGLVELNLGGQIAPTVLGVSDEYVYFEDISSKSIFRCRVGGCGNAPARVTAEASDFRDLFVDHEAVFWAAGDRVLSIPKDGREGEPRVLFRASDAMDFRRIVGDAEFLYLTAGSGVVMRIPKAGGEAKVLWRGTKETHGIVLTDTDVYFSENARLGAVRRISKKSLDGVATLLADSQSHSTAIAIDETMIYWLTQSNDGGALMSCRLPSCAELVERAPSREAPTNLALDETAIYWTNTPRAASPKTAGSIMKLAKP